MKTVTAFLLIILMLSFPVCLAVQTDDGCDDVPASGVMISVSAKPVYGNGDYIVTAKKLNVRAGAGTSYRTLGTLKSGTEVSIIEVSGNWGKIQANGKEGWICLDHCTSSSGNADVPASDYIITASKLKVRSGAGTGYSCLGKLKYGTVVEIVEIKNGWGKIVSGNKSGWICLEYCKKQ